MAYAAYSDVLVCLFSVYTGCKMFMLECITAMCSCFAVTSFCCLHSHFSLYHLKQAFSTKLIMVHTSHRSSAESAKIGAQNWQKAVCIFFKIVI